jgi:hypothetical protein
MSKEENREIHTGIVRTGLSGAAVSALLAASFPSLRVVFVLMVVMYIAWVANTVRVMRRDSDVQHPFSLFSRS